MERAQTKNKAPPWAYIGRRNRFDDANLYKPTYSDSDWSLINRDVEPKSVYVTYRRKAPDFNRNRGPQSQGDLDVKPKLHGVPVRSNLTRHAVFCFSGQLLAADTRRISRAAPWHTSAAGRSNATPLTVSRNCSSQPSLWSSRRAMSAPGSMIGKAVATPAV